MEMGDGDEMSSGPLSPAGVDFSDPDQAADFLERLLNDDQLKVVGNAYARYFWYGVIVVVGVAAAFHWTRRALLYLRLRAAAKGEVQAATPRNAFTQFFATITAMAREVTYFQFTPTQSLLWLRIPPAGTLILIFSHLLFILALEFNNDSVTGAQFWQARGVRAGWLAVAQMPLLILLVGKHNILTLITGISHERLNVFHRWSARIMLLLAILHFGFQMRAWSDYGLVKLEWSTDDCPTTGIAAFAILLWMNISTLAPFRSWSYEFFLVQHLLTFFGFIVAIMYHLPSTALGSRVYIYIPIALYFVDRVLRTAVLIWNNYRLSSATLTSLDGNVTKIRLHNAQITRWTPGSYALLSIPRFGLIQAHPATIASTPRSHSGDMVFILKGHKGFTKRIMAGANDSQTALIPHTKKEAETQQNAQVATYYALINGPYGGSHSDFAAFDSVCLLSGSTGITFNLAILQDIAERATLRESKLPVRRVHFVWCVKETSWTSWVNEEISTAVSRLESGGIAIEVSIYVTCADTFTEQGTEVKECGCACDKSLGPCCCVAVADDDEDEELAVNGPKTAAVAATKTSTVTEKATSLSSELSDPKQVAVRLPILPRANFYSGRPAILEILLNLLESADGESGISVCGPIGLTTTVRNSVVRLSDERAIHKGTGAQGCYLHVENFS